MKRFTSALLVIIMLIAQLGVLPVSAAENCVTYLDMSANALPTGYKFTDESYSFSSDSLYGKEDDAYACMPSGQLSYTVENSTIGFTEGSTIFFSTDFATSSAEALPRVQFRTYRPNGKGVNPYYSGEDTDYNAKKIQPGVWHNLSIAVTMNSFAQNAYNNVKVWVDGELSHETSYKLVQPTNGYYNAFYLTNPTSGNNLYIDNFYLSIFPSGEAPSVTYTEIAPSSSTLTVDTVNKTIVADSSMNVGAFKNAVENVIVLDADGNNASDDASVFDCKVYSKSTGNYSSEIMNEYEVIPPVAPEFMWDVSDETLPYRAAFDGGAAYAFDKGVYGKAADDVSLLLSNGGLYQIMEIDFANNIGEGDRIEVMFDAAFSEFNGEHDFFINMVPTANKNVFYNNGAKQNYGLDISNGNVIFFGNTTNATIEAQKWNSYKLIYDILPGAKSARVSLYIEDKKIDSDVLTVGTAISSIYYIRFSSGNEASYCLDDIGVKISDSERVLEEAVSADFNDSAMPDNFKAVDCTPEYVSGKFLKGAEDVSVRINEGYIDFKPVHDIMAGDKIKYSFDFAVDSLGNGAEEKAFPILFNHEKVQILDLPNAISIQNGRILVFGLDRGISVEEKKWYKMTIAAEMDETGKGFTMTGYINGKSFDIGTYSISDIIHSVGALRFADLSGSGLYIDNVYFDVFADGTITEELKVPSITALETEGKKLIDNTKKKINIYSCEDITVGEFKALINTDNVRIFAYGDTEADDNDKLINSKVYAVSDDIYCTRYTVNNSREYFMKFEDFEDETNLVLGANEAYTDVKFKSDSFSSEYGKALILEGKSTSDNVVTVENDYAPMVEYNFTHSGASVFTIEFMLNIKGNNSTYNIQVRDKNGGTSYLPVTLNSDGTFATYKDSIKVSELWSRGEWIPVTITVYTKSMIYDLYVNGKYIGTSAGSNLSDLNQIRIIQRVSQGSEMSDVLAVDNMRVYEGTPENYYIEYYKEGNTVADIKNADSVFVRATYQKPAVAVLATYDESGTALIKTEIGKDIMMGGIEDADNLILYLWENLTETLKPIEDAKELIGDEKIVLANDAKVAGAIDNGMVLQRNEPIVIWGSAESEDGTSVKVALDGNVAYGTVIDGKWEAVLPEMEADNEPKTLSVTTLSGTESFTDILIGDVYMVGGQSNGFLQMVSTSDYEEYLAKASEDDNIRYVFQASGSKSTSYWADKYFSDIKREDPYPTNYWKVANSENLNEITSIGYYTAASLRESGIDVPLGIISVAHNGTGIAQMVPSEVASANGVTGSKSYNALSAPFEKIKLAGFLWYQGENDSKSDATIDSYEAIFSDYVAYIRNIRNQPDIKVFAVQLSSHDPVSLSSWNVPTMRAAQYDYSKNIDGLYLIPSLDKGPKSTDPDFAHPRYKLDIGKRIAAIAEAVIYGTKNLEDAAAPVPSNIVYDENGATITFKNTVGGLKVSTGETPAGFELTKDGVAYAATASIVDDKTIRIEGVQNPDGVRYAFYHAAAPALANIVNSNGLPCPTFVDAKAGSGATSVSIRKIPALSTGYLEQ